MFGTVLQVGEYAELHCHTNFSFLDGASHPEELVAEAARLGLAALAVTDHDGFYGIVRFALGGPGPRAPDRLRRRAHARDHGSRERRARSRRRAPPRARGRAGRARASLACDQRGADGGGEGRTAHLHRAARRRGPSAGAPPSARERAQRLVVRAHRLPQGHGAGGARARRPRRGPLRARPARRRLRARPRAHGAVGPRRSARPPSQRRARATSR